MNEFRGYYIQADHVFSGCTYRYLYEVLHQRTFDRPHRFIIGASHNWAHKVLII